MVTISLKIAGHHWKAIRTDRVMFRSVCSLLTTGYTEMRRSWSGCVGRNREPWSVCFSLLIGGLGEWNWN